MALKLISVDSTPAYLALSSDISGGLIEGATLIGKTVYLTDTGAWKIIASVSGSSGSIVEYKSPA